MFSAKMFATKFPKIACRGKIGRTAADRKLAPIFAVLTFFDTELMRKTNVGLGILIWVPGVPQKIFKNEGLFAQI
jgi:hypothetical protein